MARENQGSGTPVRDDHLDDYVEPDPAKLGLSEWRLKERAVPVWTIIGALMPNAENVAQVASDYGVSPRAIAAAQAFYHRHQALIDARLAENAA